MKRPESEIPEMLTALVQSIVDEPESVQVTSICGTQSTVLELTVARDDVRRVVGKGGRTIDAMREFLVNWSSMYGRRFILNLIEPHKVRTPEAD